MLLDDRYPVLETLESRDGVTLYRVEGGWSSTLTSARPRTRTASTATGRRSGAWRSSASEAQVSAKPGRYYAFFPERPLSGRRPPRRSWPPWPPSASGRSTWPWGRTRWPTSPLGPSAWGPRGGAGGVLVPGGPGAFPPGPGPPPLGPGALPLLQPPEYVVPDLVGKTAREAFLLLRDTGLGLEVEEGNDPSGPRRWCWSRTPTRHPPPSRAGGAPGPEPGAARARPRPPGPPQGGGGGPAFGARLPGGAGGRGGGRGGGGDRPRHEPPGGDAHGLRGPGGPPGGGGAVWGEGRRSPARGPEAGGRPLLAERRGAFAPGGGGAFGGA